MIAPNTAYDGKHIDLDSVGDRDIPRSSEMLPTGFEIEISPSRLIRLLALLIAILVVVGTAARVVIYQLAPTPDHPLARLMKRFDLGHEPSLPGWYSSMALFAAACLLAAIGMAMTHKRDRSAFHWWSLSALFVLLAIDEAVMFHEMANNVTRNLFHTGLPPIFVPPSV
ncbi:MAG: hypothetical protein HON53_23455, partial [Planctomycetaceae bacterium]|nr:hypothetical protein [Planctomycetaceae bacterium]